MLGAMVTSNDAGLSVPDWPTSFGSLYTIPPMVVAEFIGLLIIVMAVWTRRLEPRNWMRVLGWIGLAAVIGQGVLGGLTDLFYLPWAISTAHATLAEHRLTLSTPVLTALAAACVWVQLILGAAFRHTGLKLLPHLIGACVVTAVLCWTVVRVLTRYAGVPQLRKPVQLILALLMVQLGLGFASYLARLEWMLNAPQPTTGIVISTVSHVAGGALLLASSVVLAIPTRRIISVRAQESVVATSSRKAVTV